MKLCDLNSIYPNKKLCSIYLSFSSLLGIDHYRGLFGYAAHGVYCILLYYLAHCMGVSISLWALSVIILILSIFIFISLSFCINLHLGYLPLLSLIYVLIVDTIYRELWYIFSKGDFWLITIFFIYCHIFISPLYPYSSWDKYPWRQQSACAIKNK